MAGRARKAVGWAFGESKPKKKKSTRAKRAAGRVKKAASSARKAHKRVTRPVKPFKFHA